MNFRQMLFRAWDNKNKEWVLVRLSGESVDPVSGSILCRFKKEFTLDEIVDIRAFPDNYIILRWTGLCDSKKTAIFEDDIVSAMFANEEGEERTRYGHIYWAEDHAGFAIDFKQFIVFNFKNNRSMTVVGNIYEHQHILEKSL